MKLMKFFLFVTILTSLIGIILVKTGGAEKFPVLAQIGELFQAVMHMFHALAETDLAVRTKLWETLPDGLRFILGMVELGVYILALVGFWTVAVVRGLAGGGRQ